MRSRFSAGYFLETPVVTFPGPDGRGQLLLGVGVLIVALIVLAWLLRFAAERVLGLQHHGAVSAAHRARERP